MSTAGPLNTTGVDFSNETQAADFLAALLDDSELSVTANTFSTYFWFGVVALVGVVAVYNVALDMQLKARYVGYISDPEVLVSYSNTPMKSPSCKQEPTNYTCKCYQKGCFDHHRLLPLGYLSTIYACEIGPLFYGSTGWDCYSSPGILLFYRHP